MQERTRLESQIQAVRDLESGLSDNLELIEMGEAEGDQEIIADAEAIILGLGKIAAKSRIESLLSGEADANDTFLEVHAGAGGTESQDWAEMLVRMYQRWSEARGYSVAWVQETPGEEAGVKSATLRVSGNNAYGWLKTESGVHRLVRISPFDSSARRHTSFASVWVYPVVEDTIEIEILAMLHFFHVLLCVEKSRRGRTRNNTQPRTPLPTSGGARSSFCKREKNLRGKQFANTFFENRHFRESPTPVDNY